MRQEHHNILLSYLATQKREILYKRAGISKRVHPHTMRHTNATHALENGMPIEEVKEMLGHESIDTTLVYAAVASSKVKQSHKKCVI